MLSRFNCISFFLQKYKVGYEFVHTMLYTLNWVNLSMGIFRRSGYDRGHLAAAANHRSSQDSMCATFFLSNMSPQVGELTEIIFSSQNTQNKLHI